LRDAVSQNLTPLPSLTKHGGKNLLRSVLSLLWISKNHVTQEFPNPKPSIRNITSMLAGNT